MSAVSLTHDCADDNESQIDHRKSRSSHVSAVMCPHPDGPLGISGSFGLVDTSAEALNAAETEARRFASIV